MSKRWSGKSEQKEVGEVESQRKGRDVCRGNVVLEAKKEL